MDPINVDYRSDEPDEITTFHTEPRQAFVLMRYGRYFHLGVLGDKEAGGNYPTVEVWEGERPLDSQIDEAITAYLEVCQLVSQMASVRSAPYNGSHAGMLEGN